MSNSLTSKVAALFCTIALAACFGGKPEPKSTTVTRTQSTTEQAGGQTTSSDVEETRTEQADGTQDVVRTETTTQSKPAATP
jgi:hypothetical protein